MGSKLRLGRRRAASLSHLRTDRLRHDDETGEKFERVMSWVNLCARRLLSYYEDVQAIGRRKKRHSAIIFKQERNTARTSLSIRRTHGFSQATKCASLRRLFRVSQEQLLNCTIRRLHTRLRQTRTAAHTLFFYLSLSLSSFFRISSSRTPSPKDFKAITLPKGVVSADST